MKALTISILAILFISTNAFAHCIVPSETEWHFVCSDSEGQVEVIARVFKQTDPRNCTSQIDFDYQGEHPVNQVSQSFSAGKPIVRRQSEGDLEFLLGFGQQNHFAAYLSEKTTKGYIEFAGGPSWDLDCKRKH